MPHHRVCPWWLGYVLVSPVRRLWQDPAKILAPYIRAGMTILKPGSGMGFFTLELARLAGPSGRVIAVDIQPKMLERLRRRLARSGLAERVSERLAEPQSMAVADLAGTVDFVLACAVVHEFPSAEVFFRETAQCLKPGGRLLLAEPAGHVSAAEFQTGLKQAAGAGFALTAHPVIRRCRAALLERLPEAGQG